MCFLNKPKDSSNIVIQAEGLADFLEYCDTDGTAFDTSPRMGIFVDANLRDIKLFPNLIVITPKGEFLIPKESTTRNLGSKEF